MTTEAQILANRRLGRRIVLNLGHFDFEIVSTARCPAEYFDIRISDFNHSGCFMQNKPNLLDTQMNIRSLITVDYENIANWKLGENKANTKPIKANTNPKQTQPVVSLSVLSLSKGSNLFQSHRLWACFNFLLWDLVRRKLCSVTV